MMINSWELLLKAEIIKEHAGNLRSMQIMVNKVGKRVINSKQK
jgi:hypothetical protein